MPRTTFFVQKFQFSAADRAAIERALNERGDLDRRIVHLEVAASLWRQAQDPGNPMHGRSAQQLADELDDLAKRAAQLEARLSSLSVEADFEMKSASTPPHPLARWPAFRPNMLRGLTWIQAAASVAGATARQSSKRGPKILAMDRELAAACADVWTREFEYSRGSEFHEFAWTVFVASGARPRSRAGGNLEGVLRGIVEGRRSPNKARKPAALKR